MVRKIVLLCSFKMFRVMIVGIISIGLIRLMLLVVVIGVFFGFGELGDNSVYILLINMMVYKVMLMMVWVLFWVNGILFG